MFVAQKAVDSGALFAHGAVKRLLIDSDGLVSCTLQGSDKRFRARIVILATGTNIGPVRKLNWPAKKRPSAVALRCYVHSTYALDRMVVSCDKSIQPGYAWIFPMRNQQYNMGCGISLIRTRKCNFNLKKTFNHFIADFPLARQLMKKSKKITPLRWGALRHDFEGLYPFVKGPIVAVGETIGTTLPFLAEGIGKAMESGQGAAKAVCAALDSDDFSKLSRYGRFIDSELRPSYQNYRRAEKWLKKSWLMDFLSYRSANSAYAKDILTGMINETRNPKDLFSLIGICKTFWN
jgi:flavin-dependent dehydrogenase